MLSFTAGQSTWANIPDQSSGTPGTDKPRIFGTSTANLANSPAPAYSSKNFVAGSQSTAPMQQTQSGLFFAQNSGAKLSNSGAGGDVRITQATSFAGNPTSFRSTFTGSTSGNFNFGLAAKAAEGVNQAVKSSAFGETGTMGNLHVQNPSFGNFQESSSFSKPEGFSGQFLSSGAPPNVVGPGVFSARPTAPRIPPVLPSSQSPGFGSPRNPFGNLGPLQSENSFGVPMFNSGQGAWAPPAPPVSLPGVGFPQGSGGAGQSLLLGSGRPVTQLSTNSYNMLPLGSTAQIGAQSQFDVGLGSGSSYAMEDMPGGYGLGYQGTGTESFSETLNGHDNFENQYLRDDETDDNSNLSESLNQLDEDPEWSQTTGTEEEQDTADVPDASVAELLNSMQKEIDRLKIAVEEVPKLREEVDILTRALHTQLGAAGNGSQSRLTQPAAVEPGTTDLAVEPGPYEGTEVISPSTPRKEADLPSPLLSSPASGMDSMQELLRKAAQRDVLWVERLALVPHNWTYKVVCKKDGQVTMYTATISAQAGKKLSSSLFHLTKNLQPIRLPGVEPTFAQQWQAKPSVCHDCPRTPTEWTDLMTDALQSSATEQLDELGLFLCELQAGRVAWVEYYAWWGLEEGDVAPMLQGQCGGYLWYSAMLPRGEDEESNVGEVQSICMRHHPEMFSEGHFFGYLQAHGMTRDITSAPSWTKKIPRNYFCAPKIFSGANLQRKNFEIHSSNADVFSQCSLTQFDKLIALARTGQCGRVEAVYDRPSRKAMLSFETCEQPTKKFLLRATQDGMVDRLLRSLLNLVIEPVMGPAKVSNRDTLTSFVWLKAVPDGGLQHTPVMSRQGGK